MIKRLIFDVDGTLIVGVDFTATNEKTLKQLDIYSKENVEIFLKNIKIYESIYDNYNVHDYIRHMGKALRIELPSNFLGVFFENLRLAIPHFNNNLIEVIKNLSSKYELVLLTNYFKESQLNRLNNMGIGEFFSECYGEEIIKPNIEAYINACGCHKPSECVMIGDDIILDIEGAKKAGLYTILVNSKGISVSEVDTVIVDKVENITEELINGSIK